MGSADWRSPDGYKDLLQLDAPGLAWEFLRRNPVFLQDHAKMQHAVENNRGTPQELEAFALRWGIRFRERYRTQPTAMDAVCIAECYRHNRWPQRCVQPVTSLSGQHQLLDRGNWRAWNDCPSVRCYTACTGAGNR